MDVAAIIILAVLAVALLTALALIGLSAHRRGRRLERALAEGEQMRGTLAALQAEVAELKQAGSTPALAARQFVPAPTITADQRAEALEMLRRGADPATVSASIGLSQPEVDLLQKMQNLQHKDPAATQAEAR